MQIEILYRPSQSLARCRLAPGESIVAESGALVGMSRTVEMTTAAGGLMQGLKRMIGGESFFRNTFTARGRPGEVLLSTPLPGDMAVLEVGARSYRIQSSCYVASTEGVEIDARLEGFGGFFSGAGLFVVEATGRGQVVLGSFGALEPMEVDGEVVLDTGHLAAWESTLDYEIGKAATGWIASLLSGEGLACRFLGRGTVWVQARNASEFGRTVGGLLPPRRE